MLLQFQHSLVQSFEVVHEMAHLGVNLVGGLAHAGIFLDLLNDLDGEHQQRGRDDDDLGAERLLHDVIEAVM